MFGIITLLSALALAATAAWFAIAGIMAVFAGAPIAALVMGTVIEVGKIVSISWLYRNWKEPTKLKYALIPLVFVAMLLTSMGIFGFLSKAHIEQNAPVANNSLQIERLDQRIQKEQAKVKDAEQVTAQLDQTVNALIKFDKISGPTGARAVRENQQAQRDLLKQTIADAQSSIDKYEDQKLTLSQQLKQLEVEVGPVKYIAALIYDDPKSKLEDAVRMVIIAFIFVFDPMAIVLLMAANYTLMQGRKKPQVAEQSAPVAPIQPAPLPVSQGVAQPVGQPIEQKSAPADNVSNPSRPGKFVHNDRQGQKFKPIT